MAFENQEKFAPPTILDKIELENLKFRKEKNNNFFNFENEIKKNLNKKYKVYNSFDDKFSLRKIEDSKNSMPIRKVNKCESLPINKKFVNKIEM